MAIIHIPKSIQPKHCIANAGYLSTSPEARGTCEEKLRDPSHVVRNYALSLPSLQHRNAAIDLGLSDPRGHVRLESAKRLVSKWLIMYAENGFSGVQESIESRLCNPKVAYQSNRDPRLFKDLAYDPVLSKRNIRLGVLMAFQNLYRQIEPKAFEASELSKVQKENLISLSQALARYLSKGDLKSAHLEGKIDMSFARKIVQNNLELPDLDGLEPKKILFYIIKYGSFAAAFADSILRKTIFKDLRCNEAVLLRSTPTGCGIETTATFIIKALENLDKSRLLAEKPDDLLLTA